MEQPLAHSLIYVLIPVYNEDASVLQATLAEWSGGGRRLVVIDDGSTLPLRLADKSVTLLRHLHNQGQGAAIRTGIAHVCAEGGAVAITCDADGQHPATNFSTLIEPILTGQADVVFGSRFLRSEHAKTVPLFRRLVLGAATIFNNFVTGLPLSDAHNGLRALNRRAMESITITENRMEHASEIPLEVHRHGLRWTEVPTLITYSAYASRKGQSLWRVFPLAFRLLRLKWKKRALLR